MSYKNKLILYTNKLYGIHLKLLKKQEKQKSKLNVCILKY